MKKLNFILLRGILILIFFVFLFQSCQKQKRDWVCKCAISTPTSLNSKFGIKYSIIKNSNKYDAALECEDQNNYNMDYYYKTCELYNPN